MANGPIPFAKNWTFFVAGRRSWIDAWIGPVLDKAAGGSTSITSAPVYYDYQAFLETKILKLRERLTSAVVVADEDEEGAHARFGSQVTLRDEESGKELTYRLVGATEASLADGKLSVESPVAQAVVGRMAGDKVVVPTPRGDRGYTLMSVD